MVRFAIGMEVIRATNSLRMDLDVRNEIPLGRDELPLGGGTVVSQGRCTSKIWRDHGWKAGCGANEEPSDNQAVECVSRLRSADVVAVELNTCQPERLSQRGRYLRATSPSKYGHCTEICVVCVTKDAQ